MISLLDIFLFALIFFFLIILLELLLGVDAEDVDDIAFVSFLVFVFATSFIFLIILWGKAIAF